MNVCFRIQDIRWIKCIIIFDVHSLHWQQTPDRLCAPRGNQAAQAAVIKRKVDGMLHPSPVGEWNARAVTAGWGATSVLPRRQHEGILRLSGKSHADAVRQPVSKVVHRERLANQRERDKVNEAIAEYFYGSTAAKSSISTHKRT